MLKEEVQLWVAAGVECDLEQRHEDIRQHFFKVTQLLLCVVDVTERKIRDVICVIMVMLSFQCTSLHSVCYISKCSVNLPTTGVTHNSRGTCTSQRTFFE